MSAPDAGLGERIARAYHEPLGWDLDDLDPDDMDEITKAMAPVVALVAEEVAAAEVRALREAADEALASPSTRLGDLHSGEVWAAWLNARADRLATTDGGGDRG